MENEKYFLGIDLGTSAMKLVLIDGNKKVLAQVTEEYEVACPKKNWSEIDPEIWYQCMLVGMKKILRDVDSRKLKGIGVTGQMHTLVTIGMSGKPVRSAIMWNDMRTKELIPELKKVFRGFPEGVYLANTVSTGSPVAGLYWMKKTEPELFAAIRKFLIGPDYLVYRLTGNCTTDYCEASTSCLYNIEEKKWSKEMQSFLGLSDSAYPDIGSSSGIAGYVTAELAREMGISEEVFVIYGTGDNSATAISTGCLGKGYPVISLGTSGILMMPLTKLKPEAKGKRVLLSLEENKFQYLVQGAIQATGNTLDWWIKKIYGESDYSALESLDLSLFPVEHTVMFYPHLMGEKTIYADSSLRGAFFGLDMGVDRMGMLYAVLEGLSMGFRELAERMCITFGECEGIKVVGGGARSDQWLQILSNVLQVRVERLEGIVSPAYGIALLAALRGGCITKVEDIISGVVTVRKYFEPDEKRATILETRYQRYCRMHRAMKIWEGKV